MSVPDWLDSAAGFATCSILSSAGSALVGTGVATLAAGGGGIVPLTLGSLSLLAAGAACQPTAVDGKPSLADGCIEMSPGGYGVFQYSWEGFDWTDCGGQLGCSETTAITSTEVVQDQGTGQWLARAAFTSTQGSDVWQLSFDNEALANTARFRIRPVVGTCADSSGPEYPPNIHDPVEYTDPATGCTYNVSFQGFAADVVGGAASPVFKIEALPTSRNTGGIVGGCNFEPVIYQQPPGGGGPPRIGPWDPTWPDWDGGGTPPWLDFLSSLAGGIVSNIITDSIAEAFQQPVPQYQYTMRAACNYKQDGSYETYTITLPEQPWETRVLAMQEMNIDFLQQHLLWKTPTCSGGGVGIAGDPVTVNFISDEYSPDGNDRIKKRFVYFDQTGTPLEDHVTHWKDFVWNAGPACVNLEGTPMGKCQVWASTVDEGKRVITHAAAIAGIDVADGEWKVASSRSSRYGQPGTMRVAHFTNGNYTVTKRPGPSGNPEACG
jgi:hypothetical protein